MSSRIPWYVVSLLLVGCGTILWFFWDNVKKRRRPNKKEIFISADCWLEVFALLPPSQLGLEIALISRRFDLRVDEHFKTRKWIFDKGFWIRKKKCWNGTNEMEIVSANEGKALPIPQIPLPNKLIGFNRITFTYFDRNVITFLGRFHRFFASSTITLTIATDYARVLEFFVSTIWPMFGDSIRHMSLNTFNFRRLRQLAPSILNDYPSLCTVTFIGNILPEFPPDDSANASDGQAVTKWLCTPRSNGVPKVFKYTMNSLAEEWPSIIEQFKAAFSAASSPAAFLIIVQSSASIDSVVPSFLLTNELTGEQLTLIQLGQKCCLFRCPIPLDASILEEMANELKEGWNQIEICVGKHGVDEGLLDASPGPSGQHQKEVND